jgi:hypothetical protein
MKPVATALVLILSAAVVLWYGNTLNSWVLGGLIGGLAALLLSVPISLVLFSYLSRHHDERLRTEISQEAMSADSYNYADTRSRGTKRVYDVEGHALSTGHLLSTQSAGYAQKVRQQKDRLATGGKDTTERRTTKAMRDARLPADTSERSRYHSAALRTARLEATQQWYDEFD